ncbi:3-keto-disaccharide hydrolase [Algoriphagus sediminis]|uniref:DUF1080 domain-containing protein n=1 Tax=Algoriphagus sediminis TaxID=3057113 RepID=A0ABT7YB51_9BACT|nr:DUF1080 domain-containing protein [Algoriphagus sediminis]MDN3203755.1 DUF1080 domain-containing protein [Algoriphagus sediminis]
MLDNELSIWETYGDADWNLEEGVLSASVSDTVGFVMTKESFKNFELELEFWPDSTINSGIFVRCLNRELSFVDCYEINIWDAHPNQDFRTGSIVNRANPLNYVETIGKWNTYRIKVKDNRVEAWVNSIKTADLENMDLKEGFIALQAMGTGEVKFRNVKIEVLN